MKLSCGDVQLVQINLMCQMESFANSWDLFNIRPSGTLDSSHMESVGNSVMLPNGASAGTCATLASASHCHMTWGASLFN